MNALIDGLLIGFAVFLVVFVVLIVLGARKQEARAADERERLFREAEERREEQGRALRETEARQKEQSERMREGLERHRRQEREQKEMREKQERDQKEMWERQLRESEEQRKEYQARWDAVQANVRSATQLREFVPQILTDSALFPRSITGSLAPEDTLSTGADTVDLQGHFKQVLLSGRYPSAVATPPRSLSPMTCPSIPTPESWSSTTPCLRRVTFPR